MKNIKFSKCLIEFKVSLKPTSLRMRQQHDTDVRSCSQTYYVLIQIQNTNSVVN